MSELEELWSEVHDAEARVGQIEDQAIREHAAAQTRQQVRSERLAKLRSAVQWSGAVLGVISTALLVLTRLHVF